MSNTRSLDRRRFLATAASSAGLAGLSRLSLPLAGLGAGTPLMAMAQQAGGDFELTAAPAEWFLAGEDQAPSTLWLYGSSLPGPTIRARKGERLRIRFTNRLEEPTSVHWHGIRIENSMDGVAGLTQPAVEPGESFVYDFALPDSGTYWYHAHNRSWNQVTRGLYGPMIIAEEDTPYQPQGDVTLIMDDWRIANDGSLHVESLGARHDWSHAGRLGNWLTVNGTTLPHHDLPAGKPCRLRLINASNARVLAIDPARLAGHVIALDGQPLARPVPLGDAPLRIAPAQRLDLGLIPEAGQTLALSEISGGEALEFATFAAVGPGSAVAASDTIPALPPNRLAEPDLANARKITIDMTGGAMSGTAPQTYRGKPVDRQVMMESGQFWAFNGAANLTEAPMFEARRGETILLEVANRTAFAHGMHLHGHHFRVVGNDGLEPWRDTFLIDRQETVSVAFVADNPGKWLFHCHMLEHAAAGMSNWFTVA